MGNCAFTGTADAGNAKTTVLGGTYDFGVVKVHATYAVNKGETATGATNVDHEDALLGVSVPLDARLYVGFAGGDAEHFLVTTSLLPGCRERRAMSPNLACIPPFTVNVKLTFNYLMGV